MSFVGTLGLVAFILVCLTVAIVTLTLKLQYEKGLKKKTDPSAAKQGK